MGNMKCHGQVDSVKKFFMFLYSFNVDMDIGSII